MCIAAGNVSFDDCPMFTWSFGWTAPFLALRAEAEAQPMIRQVGDHLVGVRVGRSAGAGLVDVDREVRVVLAGGHFFAGGDDRLGEFFVELAELHVGRAQAAFRWPKA